MSEHFYKFVTVCVQTLVLHVSEVVVAMKQVQPIEALSCFFQGYVGLCFEVCCTDGTCCLCVVCAYTGASSEQLIAEYRD